MVLVYLIGNNADKKKVIIDQFKKANKYKRICTIEEPESKSHTEEDRHNVQFWVGMIDDHFNKIKQCINDDNVYNKKRIDVIDYGIIDILVDASSTLTNQKFNSLSNGNTCTAIDKLLTICQSSLVCVIDYNKFPGKVLPEQQEKQDTKHEKFDRFIKKYSLPVLHLGPDEEHRTHVLKNAINNFKFPLNTSKYIAKKSKPLKLEGTSNFLFSRRINCESDKICIPSIDITVNEYENGLTIIPSGRTNRFFTRYPSAKDKLVQFYFHVSVKSEVVHNMLLHGVTVNGQQYSFLGCSSDGLKYRKCFMWQGTEDEVNSIVQENGTFDQNVVSKRMSRFGLLFSELIMTDIEIKQDQIKEENDIISDCKRYNFTDGCGGISFELAKQVTKNIIRIDNVELDINNPPSIFKIRLQGYKGVLALDKDIQGHMIKIRPSMKKFNTTAHPFLGICDYSKPFTFGHLNRQYIQLLSGLGVQDEVFETIQETHLDLVNQMCSSLEAAISVLQWQKQTNLVKTVTQVSSMGELPDDIMKQIRKVQAGIISRSDKLRILIPKSRYIFGVCDPYGILKHGECFVRVTTAANGICNHVSGQVVVCKTPCYLLGDVRVLRAVSEKDRPDVERLNHLVDCIVFPVRGSRPHPNEIAGSDLDGDTFFVSWNERLIPKTRHEPYDYPAAPSRPEGRVTLEKMLMHFSNQDIAQRETKIVADSFKYWCDKEGATSEKCELLGMLFSRIIDSSKTGVPTKIPAYLIKPNLDTTTRKQVWQKLEERADEFKKSYRKDIKHFVIETIRMTDVEKDRKSFTMDITHDFVIDFLSETQSQLTEFEKFKFAWNHARYNNEDAHDDDEVCDVFMDKYVNYINFAQFSGDETRCAQERGIPTEFMLNDLNKSQLLTRSDLSWFSMDTGETPWRFFVRKDSYELSWSYLVKALTNSDNTAVIMEVPGDILVVLQFHFKQEMGVELTVSPGSISAIFFSKNFGYRYKYSIGADYYLDFTDDMLQIYRNKERSQTFVWLKSTDFDKKVDRNTRKENIICTESKNTMSVDLSRFYRNIYRNEKPHPLFNKLQLSKVEIFVRNDTTNDVIINDVIDALGDFPSEERIEEDSGEDEFNDSFDVMLNQQSSAIPLDTPPDELRNKLQTSAFRIIIADFEHQITRLEIRNQDVIPVIVDSVVLLLENIIRRTKPTELPDEIKTRLQFTASIEQFVTDMTKRLYIAYLGLNDIAIHFLSFDTIGSFLKPRNVFEILQNWKLFWYLPADISIPFIDRLVELSFQNIDNTTTHTQETNNLKYLIHYGRLHALSLASEIEKLKNRFQKLDTQSINPSSVRNLKIDRNKEGDQNILCFYRSAALEYVPKIYEGQFLSVCRQFDLKRNTSYMSVAFLAQVQSVTQAPFFVEVKIHGGIIPQVIQSTLDSKHVRLWKIDVISNLVTYHRVMEAMKIAERNAGQYESMPILPLLSYPNLHHRKSILFNKSSDPVDLSAMNKKSDILYSRTNKDTLRRICNDKQVVAIETALNMPVTCIEGPPGTGKTTVACLIIEEIVRSNGYKQILVVAETNNAINNITRKLRGKTAIVRMGTPDGIPNDLYDISLDGKIDRKKQIDVVYSRIPDKKGNIVKNKKLYTEVIKESRIVLTTCGGVGDSLLDNLCFEFVLVDEASYTMETTLLCSLVHGCRQLVMIGDSVQLSPLMVKTLSEPSDVTLSNASDLSCTLFHRLRNSKSIYYVTLNQQYRMHPSLLEFPSNEFYAGSLVCDKSVHNIPSVVFPWVDPACPICFIDTKGTDKLVGSSYSNVQEAQMVSDVIDKLIAIKEKDVDDFQKLWRLDNVESLSIKQVSVLTFYQGQVACIKETITSRVQVGTVDAYQGCENDVIVASTVRANRQGSLGFTDERSRLNVLFTRAKRALIVIGNRETLSKSEIWMKWLKTVHNIESSEIKKAEESRISFPKKYEKPYTKTVNPKKSRQKKY